MSKNTQYRYEVGNPDYGVIEHTSTKNEALTVAQNWIEKNHLSVEIFDRMAHKSKPNLWLVRECTGEAHSNPFIDYCGVCVPNWGIVVTALPRLEFNQ